MHLHLLTSSFLLCRLTAFGQSIGTLYALQRSGSTGTWLPIDNNTPSERNGTQVTAATAGATNFNGIEDVEIGPNDSMIYFASKNNSVIYRFTDDGTTISNFETFVASVNYTINWQNGGSSGSTSVAWGIGNDNLALDGEGNL